MNNERHLIYYLQLYFLVLQSISWSHFNYLDKARQTSYLKQVRVCYLLKTKNAKVNTKYFIGSHPNKNLL